jgi:lambda repressor-like predicted transcriptional regulator
MEQFINTKLKERGKSKAWLARQMGIYPQALNKKIKLGSWTLKDFLIVLDAFGVGALEILEAVKKMKEGE